MKSNHFISFFCIKSTWTRPKAEKWFSASCYKVPKICMFQVRIQVSTPKGHKILLPGIYIHIPLADRFLAEWLLWNLHFPIIWLKLFPQACGVVEESCVILQVDYSGQNFCIYIIWVINKLQSIVPPNLCDSLLDTRMLRTLLFFKSCFTYYNIYLFCISNLIILISQSVIPIYQ